MSTQQTLQEILNELNKESSECIHDIKDGDFLRGNINFAKIAKEIVRNHLKKLEPESQKWISITDRLPTKEEYLKNNGRFIADDGNRRYQNYYDIYENKFCILKNGKLVKDNCIQKWHALPEPEDKPI